MMERSRHYIFFTADGELGNQMFQASYLESILARGDRLYAMGLEHLLEGFEWDYFDLTNIRNIPSRRYLKRLIRWAGRSAVGLGLIEGYKQLMASFRVDGATYHMLGGEIRHRRGLFSRIVFVDKGYFERSDIVGKGSFHLKRKFFDAPRAFLKTLPSGPVAFVHVRRGNLKPRKIFGQSPLLGPSYFIKGIEMIRAAAPDTQFVLISDSINEVVPLFEGMGLHAFRGANMYEDLALMMLADGGVISSSTFSLWGAYYCSRKLPVISPLNWHGVGFEFPVGITTPWMTPIAP